MLTEVEAEPRSRDTVYYGVYLPLMVRTALALGDVASAQRLVAGVEPRQPYAQHALLAAEAALAEDRGDAQAAADAYDQAATRWQQFGVVPEQADALLGQGRCLLALGEVEQANVACDWPATLHPLQAAPALREIDRLLGQANAVSS